MKVSSGITLVTDNNGNLNLPHDSSQLEAWYQLDNRQPGTLRIGKFTYSFDFENMRQKNTTTSNARQIRRQAQECERDDSSKLLWQF